MKTAGKFQTYIKKLEELLEEGKNNIVIVVRFTQMIDLMKACLQREGLYCMFCSNKTQSLVDKNEVINHWKMNKDCKILFLDYETILSFNIL